jgi:hypothetical protein
LAVPLASRIARLGAEAVVVAAAIPFVFLHPHYQPSVAVRAVDVTLTDLAILAAVLAGISAGLRRGWEPLRAGLAMWVPLALFLGWLLASLAWGDAADPAYGLGSHAISALKFVEYALLAPVVPLTLRRRADRRLLLWSFALWSAFLTLIGVLQFLGLVDEFEGRRPQQREPSYIGIHDFGAISGATLSLAFVAIALGRRRPLPLVGGIAGGLGVVIAAAQDAVIGMGAAAVATWGLARRRRPIGLPRTVGLVVVVVVVAVASLTLRSSAIGAFLEFLGFAPPNRNTQAHIQTYSQRTLLAYIGFEIWLRHPVVGTGWQESQHPHAFRPVLARAHRRFPHVAPASFPSNAHRWGVQNGIVQTLADLGIVGFLLAAWTFVAGIVLAGRVALRAPPALGSEGIVVVAWLLVGLLVFTGTGLLPGVAVDALLWIALGLAASLHRSLMAAG